MFKVWLRNRSLFRRGSAANEPLPTTDNDETRAVNSRTEGDADGDGHEEGHENESSSFINPSTPALGVTLANKAKKTRSFSSLRDRRSAKKKKEEEKEKEKQKGTEKEQEREKEKEREHKTEKEEEEEKEKEKQTRGSDNATDTATDTAASAPGVQIQPPLQQPRAVSAKSRDAVAPDATGSDSGEGATALDLDSSFVSIDNTAHSVFTPGADAVPELVLEEASPPLPSSPLTAFDLASPFAVGGGVDRGHVDRAHIEAPIVGGDRIAEGTRALGAVPEERGGASRPYQDSDHNHNHNRNSNNFAHGTSQSIPPHHTRTAPELPVQKQVSKMSRKVWVKRPHAAATIVLIREDDLVDEAKEVILRKYANQLGRHFDAPDVTIRIVARGPAGERVLSPDEALCRTLDTYYTGGQSIDEALILDVPPRRTPRLSPRVHNGSHHAVPYAAHYYDEASARPHESSTDYFPPMPPVNPLGHTSPLLTGASHDSHSLESRKSHAAHERAMSVLTTGQVPPLPSPGAVGRRVHQPKRPVHPRTLTASPTALASSMTSRSNRPRVDSNASADRLPNLPTAIPALPTPPLQEPKSATSVRGQDIVNPPTPRVASPRPGTTRRKTRQRQKDDGPTQLPGVILDTRVPPINVLIVEDNMINMRLLEQFVRRLGVRWQTAINGREAVNKWRQGGFHLVLMDIQLPIMSGLEATKEIRRLERVNNIGVFSSASATAPDLPEPAEREAELTEGDRLFEEGRERLFKSPVIIVALTASNLQSDRHEALAAGCNDFLTKPVNFVWFERKVKEWGCMQALIDFDGWRKWKDIAEQNGLKDPSKSTAAKPSAAASSKTSTATAPLANKNAPPKPVSVPAVAAAPKPKHVPAAELPTEVPPDADTVTDKEQHAVEAVREMAALGAAPTSGEEVKSIAGLDGAEDDAAHAAETATCDQGTKAAESARDGTAGTAQEVDAPES